MKLLKEWENFEHLQKKVITDFCRWEDNLSIIKGKHESSVELTYGLPYTSSGDFAAIWNTNCLAVWNKSTDYSLDGLAVDEYGNTVAVLSDKNNKSIYVEI